MAPASAKPSVDVVASDWPELRPDALLPPIVAELKRTLKDPYSIRDLVICAPRKASFEDGRPQAWGLMVSLSAKNSYGAYEGTSIYYARFAHGRLVGVTSLLFARDEGLEGLANASTRRQVADCPSVSDELVQKLLKGSGVIRQLDDGAVVPSSMPAPASP
jgi:hypothetical protein